MKELAKYQDSSGQEITITDVDVVKVFCDNPQVTQREVKLFVELCKAQRLNPFIREAYLVKYGDKPASLVVGKDVYTKRAQANPRFKGMQAGIFVLNKDGKGKEREGSMVLPGEHVVGGWCKVFVEGYDVPIYDSVAFDEYANKRKDGKLGGSWAKMPGTMIRKVAMVHALREAFPDEFQGMYDAAEMGVDDEPQDEQPEQPQEVAAEVLDVEPVAPAQPEQPRESPLMAAYNGLEAAVRDYCSAVKGVQGEALEQAVDAEYEAMQVPKGADEKLLESIGYDEQWFAGTVQNYRAATPQQAA